MTPPTLDPIFHQPTRTRLALLLSLRPRSFAELGQLLGVTDGNLDSHMRKLSGAGYLHSSMVLEGRPHRLYSLSESGAAAFDVYAEALETLLAARKEAPD